MVREGSRSLYFNFYLLSLAALGLYCCTGTQGQGRQPGGATHARGQGRRREELPGAVAVRAQEGLEELSHTEGQEGRQ